MCVPLETHLGPHKVLPSNAVYGNSGICVETQDTDGQGIPGYALNGLIETIGDEIVRIVGWKTKLNLGAPAVAVRHARRSRRQRLTLSERV